MNLISGTHHSCEKRECIYDIPGIYNNFPKNSIFEKRLKLFIALDCANITRSHSLFCILKFYYQVKYILFFL